MQIGKFFRRLRGQTGYSADDIRWAYQYYLGRPPESAEVVERMRTTESIFEVLYNSRERMARAQAPHQPDEFCVWRPGRPRIIVLSSCQGPALARMIAAMADVSVFGCAVIRTRQAHVAHQVTEMMAAADHVLIANFTENWGDFSHEKIKERFGAKVLTYHRPFFEALFPDQAYIDPRGPKSPVGDYHSRLIIDSFLKGLGPDECLARFTAEEYRRIGFPEIADRAIEKLKAKDEVVDVGIADIVLEHMREKPLFYTINHPTPVLQEMVARRYLERIGIPCQPRMPHMVPTVLSAGPIWPIDEIWAGMMEIGFTTGPNYWNMNYMVTREEMVYRSYEIYRRHDPGLLLPGITPLKT